MFKKGTCHIHSTLRQVIGSLFSSPVITGITLPPPGIGEELLQGRGTTVVRKKF